MLPQDMSEFIARQAPTNITSGAVASIGTQYPPQFSMWDHEHGFDGAGGGITTPRGGDGSTSFTSEHYVPDLDTYQIHDLLLWGSDDNYVDNPSTGTPGQIYTFIVRAQVNPTILHWDTDYIGTIPAQGGSESVTIYQFSMLEDTTLQLIDYYVVGSSGGGGGGDGGASGVTTPRGGDGGTSYSSGFYAPDLSLYKTHDLKLWGSDTNEVSNPSALGIPGCEYIFIQRAQFNATTLSWGTSYIGTIPAQGSGHDSITVYKFVQLEDDTFMITDYYLTDAGT